MSPIKVLVISNNELSTTDANGKTLLSIFDNDIFDIKQIYIKKTSNPSTKLSGSLYIDEGDIFKDVLKVNILKSGQDSSLENSRIMKKSAFKQCIREMIWLFSHKQYRLIDEWIQKNEFDIIFFMMGDSIFMCNLVLHILEKLEIPLLTYITDVYINDLSIKSPIDYAFKKILRKNQKRIIGKTDKLYTISDKMSSYYKKLCGKKSAILRNIAETPIIDRNRDKFNDFIYAGNLYYGRDEILVLLARVIKSINDQNKKNVHLKIYSNSILTEVLKDEMRVNSYIYWGGQLSKVELIEEISKNKYVLFVESFKEKYINKVKYSFSTKITELALQGKCIVAIAPENIGSMEDLKKFAFCITNLNELESKILSLLHGTPELYEKKAKEFSFQHYNANAQFLRLKEDISSLAHRE